MDTVAYTGHIILLMAPMGSGKSELVRHVKEVYPEVHFSISCTTRDMRPGETDGVDYYFIARDEFTEKVETDDFLEWAEFGGNLYGTLKSEVVERLKKGQVVLSEIELQGVELLKSIIPENNRTILYVDAGGWDVLKRRALGRAPMTNKELALRHERYTHEANAKPIADVIIKNLDGQLDHAKEAIDAVIKQVSTHIKS